MKAISLRGPAGIGKTTIAYAVGRALLQSCPGEKLGYVSADMFAHVSFDCQYTDAEIDFKYELIRRTVVALAEGGYSIIFDDTFQRPGDYRSMVSFFKRYGYDTRLFFLLAPLEVALSRNGSRFWKERISDARLRMLYALHSGIKFAEETQIDTLQPVEYNSELIMTLLRDERRGVA